MYLYFIANGMVNLNFGIVSSVVIQTNLQVEKQQVKKSSKIDHVWDNWSWNFKDILIEVELSFENVFFIENELFAMKICEILECVRKE